MTEWIDFKQNPPPNDLKGIIFLYEDGFTQSDRYDFETKERKFRNCPIAKWKLLPRNDPEHDKTLIKCEWGTDQPIRLFDRIEIRKND